MWSLLLIQSALAVTSPSELQDPRTEQRWILDQADVISTEDEARLNDRLQRMYVTKGAETIVVTLDQLDGNADAFAQELFRDWAIGSRNLDRGALIVVVMGNEGLSVITGHGLSADMPPEWTRSFQMETLVPHLAQGDVAGAVEAGIVAMNARVGAASRVPAAYQPSESEGEEQGTLLAWILLAAVGLGGLGYIAWRILSEQVLEEDE